MRRRFGGAIHIWLASVVESLEHSTKRFSQSKCLEVIEAFLQLATHKDTTLRQYLGDPHHGTYLADPVRLFVERQRFEAANLPRALQADERRFRALQRRLFIDLNTERAKSAP